MLQACSHTNAVLSVPPDQLSAAGKSCTSEDPQSESESLPSPIHFDVSYMTDSDGDHPHGNNYCEGCGFTQHHDGNQMLHVIPHEQQRQQPLLPLVEVSRHGDRVMESKRADSRLEASRIELDANARPREATKRSTTSLPLNSRLPSFRVQGPKAVRLDDNTILDMHASRLDDNTILDMHGPNCEGPGVEELVAEGSGASCDDTALKVLVHKVEAHCQTDGDKPAAPTAKQPIPTDCTIDCALAGGRSGCGESNKNGSCFGKHDSKRRTLRSDDMHDQVANAVDESESKADPSTNAKNRGMGQRKSDGGMEPSGRQRKMSRSAFTAAKLTFTAAKWPHGLCKCSVHVEAPALEMLTTKGHVERCCAICWESWQAVHGLVSYTGGAVLCTQCERGGVLDLDVLSWEYICSKCMSNGPQRREEGCAEEGKTCDEEGGEVSGDGRGEEGSEEGNEEGDEADYEVVGNEFVKESIEERSEAGAAAIGQLEEHQEDQVYEAECIRAQRKRKGRLEYLVKWQGYKEADSTWEPAEHILDDCLVQLWEATRASQPKRSRPQCKR